MRRKARECALQLIYQLDMHGVLADGRVEPSEVDEPIRAFWASFDSVTKDEQHFADRIVEGVLRQLPEIDEAIEGASTRWKIARMEQVDRSLLRMAAYELLWCHDIPAAAVINEAIEIAKKFSNTDASSFINGLLDQIASRRD